MKKIFIGLGIGVLAALALGAVFLRAGKKPGSHWVTQKVDTGNIAVTITASGAVAPLNSVQVGSQVSGKIREVLVEADQAVKEGQVLAVIDPELLEADRNDKELLLKQAQSNLAQLAVERDNLEIRERRAKLNTGRTQVDAERAKASLLLASKDLDRYRDLCRVCAATAWDVETRSLEKDNAERDTQLKVFDLGLLKVDLAQIEADRKSLEQRELQATLNVEQARQALAKAVTNLNYASIRAPITGVVLERAIDPGQTLAAQFTAPNLFKIVSPLDVVRIEVQLDEADVGKIKPGQKVSFDVDAYKGQQFTGVVRAVRLKSDLRNNLVTYPVLVEAPNPPAPDYPNGRLRPGMTAYLTFEVEEKKNTLRLPAAALRFAPSEEVAVEKSPVTPGAEEAAAKNAKAKKAVQAQPGMPGTVYQQGKEGGLKAVPVRVGENDGEYYELLSGNLKAADEVVTDKEEKTQALVLTKSGTE